MAREGATYKLAVIEAEGSFKARAWLFEERAGRAGSALGLAWLGETFLEEEKGPPWVEEWVSFEWKEEDRGRHFQAQPLVLFSLYLSGLIQDYGFNHLPLAEDSQVHISPPPGP